MVGQTSSEMFLLRVSASSVFSSLLIMTASWEDEFSHTWATLNWREFEAWKVGRLLFNNSHSCIASVQLRRRERGLQHWWCWLLQPSAQSRNWVKETELIETPQLNLWQRGNPECQHAKTWEALQTRLIRETPCKGGCKWFFGVSDSSALLAPPPQAPFLWLSYSHRQQDRLCCWTLSLHCSVSYLRPDQ